MAALVNNSVRAGIAGEPGSSRMTRRAKAARAAPAALDSFWQALTLAVTCFTSNGKARNGACHFIHNRLCQRGNLSAMLHTRSKPRTGSQTVPMVALRFANHQTAVAEAGWGAGMPCRLNTSTLFSARPFDDL